MTGRAGMGVTAGGANDDTTERYRSEIERARRLVAEGMDNTGFAVALVAIDEAMREANGDR